MVMPVAYENGIQQGKRHAGCRRGGGGRLKGSSENQQAAAISGRATLAAAALRRTEELKAMMAELATHFQEVSLEDVSRR